MGDHQAPAPMGPLLRDSHSYVQPVVITRERLSIRDAHHKLFPGVLLGTDHLDTLA